MSVRIIRFLPYDIPKHINGFWLLLLRKQDIAKAVLGRSIAGIDREFGPKIAFRLFPIALFEADHSGAIVRFWHLGIELKSAREFLESFDILFLLGMGMSQKQVD